MANSPESPWPSLQAPPRAQNTWSVPLNRHCMFRQQPASLNAQSLFSTMISVKGLWSEKDHQVQCQKENQKMKIKTEIMARHDQMEHNIRVDRHPKQKTIINQHMRYLKESNHMSSILPPLYADTQKHQLLSQTFPLSDRWSWSQRTSFSVLDLTLMIIAVHFQNL